MTMIQQICPSFTVALSQVVPLVLQLPSELSAVRTEPPYRTACPPFIWPYYRLILKLAHVDVKSQASKSVEMRKQGGCSTPWFWVSFLRALWGIEGHIKNGHNLWYCLASKVPKTVLLRSKVLPRFQGFSADSRIVALLRPDRTAHHCKELMYACLLA